MSRFFSSVIIFLALTVVSCSTQKSHLSYLSGLPEAREGTLASTEYSIKIMPEDELEIVVTSTVPAATAEYNMPVSNAQYSTGKNSIISATEQQKYIVDKKGDIDFPVLGIIHVAGMSTSELKNYLISRIEENVTDPKVNVKLLNFKVNVMGEVRNPRTVEVKSERFSIFDALASAGDMTEYGRRDNVTVIRETPQGLVYRRLDLTDPSVISSPYYYLQQNDVVIVDPNSVRQSNARYNTNNSYKLSVVSTIVSAISVIASLIIALTVR